MCVAVRPSVTFPQVSKWVTENMDEALNAYGSMGLDLEPANRDAACDKAILHMKNLTRVLKPDQKIDLGGGRPSFVVTKTMASNCQYLLNDLQTHRLALRFLKLPLNRKAADTPGVLSRPEEQKRADVFSACLKFLRCFLVVGRDNDSSSNSVPNIM